MLAGAEHCHEVMLGELVFTNLPPGRKHLVSTIERASHIGVRPNLRDVVVGLVSILLQLSEFSDQMLELGLEGASLRRNPLPAGETPHNRRYCTP